MRHVDLNPDIMPSVATRRDPDRHWQAGCVGVKVRHLEQVSGIQFDIFLGCDRLFDDLFDTHRFNPLALPDRPNAAEFDWENARTNDIDIGHREETAELQW